VLGLHPAGRVNDQRYVYVLVSTVHQGRYYTGLTSDVQARLAAHNAGLSKHTANGRLWRVVTTIEFSDAERARTFELYMKSGSGRAFARRYFR
jgi:predicted GIY-YIG superfamily endonuclease